MGGLLRCHGNVPLPIAKSPPIPPFIAKLRCWPTLLSFGTLAFRNILEDRNSDFRRLHGNDSPTLFRNVVSFAPVTPEFTTLECVVYRRRPPGFHRG